MLKLIATIGGFCLIFYLYRRRKRSILPLPPGPRGYPIIGNALDMPPSAVWEKYHEWCKELGSDIIYLNLAGKDVIILDSYEAVTELLEKRSSIYSDRPRMPMLGELMGFDFNFGFLPYGDRWRAQRKLMIQVFHKTSTKNLQPHMLKATHDLLRRFVDSPNDIIGNIRHMTGESIIAIAFGLEAQRENDPYIDIAERGNRLVTTVSMPGLFLVDSIPSLMHVPEWMPGAGFKRKAREWRKIAKAMLEIPSSAAKKRIDSGDYLPSFMSYSLSRMDEKGDNTQQESLIKATAATMHSAGADSIFAAITSCIIALLNHPDILKRAQEQIDSVVPFGDLPTFHEEEKLPLVTAICMETIRWRDIVPAGIPHMLSKDDVYKGYHLPKGAVVVGNAWTLLHDEQVYPDPFSFKPDRFLQDGKINKSVRDPSDVAFGYGRRVCPARLMALSAVWITVASLIAAFDIRQAVDDKGNVIDADPEYDCDTLLRLPKPFKCSMKLRSEKHRQTILATLGHEYHYAL
ncbi:Cytochrome P450 [Amanita muscaria]